MLVRLVRPLSFSLLQTFDLQRISTLKALLEHASLTIEEHSEVFQIPREASLQIFETLGNLLLIEPLTKDGAASRFAFGRSRQAFAIVFVPCSSTRWSCFFGGKTFCIEISRHAGGEPRP